MKSRQINWWFRNHRTKIQNLGAISSVLASIAALIFSFISYSESQNLKHENSIRDSITIKASETQFEKRNYFDSIQNILLEKYIVNADSILDHISVQAKIAEKQFKAQVELNKPIITAYNFTGHDTIIYPDLKWHTYQNWRLPYLKNMYRNSGVRPAFNLGFESTSFYPKSNTYFKGVKSIYIKKYVSGVQNYYYFMPMVPILDLDNFYVRHIVFYTDKDAISSQIDTIYLKYIQIPKHKFRVEYLSNKEVQILKNIEAQGELFEPDLEYMKYSKEFYK